MDRIHIGTVEFWAVKLPPPTLQYPMTIPQKLYSICCLIITTQGRKSFLFVTQPDSSGCTYETDRAEKKIPHIHCDIIHLTVRNLSLVQILKEVYESYEGEGNSFIHSFIHYQKHKFYIHWSHHTWEPK